MDKNSAENVPGHVAIIMDGNGRWATDKGLPRAAGHKAGITALREIVKYSVRSGIQFLTVYAFSSENWRRPGKEVTLLIELFMQALKEEIAELVINNVKLSFIGDMSVFPDTLQAAIIAAEDKTRANTGLNLFIAANYGGRWEIVAACKQLLDKALSENKTDIPLSENMLSEYLGMSAHPAPDLFIRTGGEKRISNFLLWQLAYTELYFTDVYWPDFTNDEFNKALSWYTGRQRRFGQTPEQIAESKRV